VSSYWDRLQSAPEGLRNHERNKILLRLIRNKKVSDSELQEFFRDKGVLKGVRYSYEGRADSSGETYSAPTDDSPQFIRLLWSERKVKSNSEFEKRFRSLP